LSTEASHQVGGFFPQGTKLEAWPRVGVEFTGAGEPHASATVTKATEVTFKGLVENGPYWMVGEVDGERRALAFTAHDSETRSLSPDEAVTQAATRRVTEKVADGAAAVRDGHEALAVEPAYSPPDRFDSLHQPEPAERTDTPAVNAEREQSEANQARRGEDKHGARVSGPVPKDAKADDGPSSARTVKGARSTSNSRRTRSTKRGAESPRARSPRKSPAKGRTKK
jgi:hypothetical protein